MEFRSAALTRRIEPSAAVAVARRETQPPAVAMDDGRGRHREERRAHDVGADRQAGHADARDVGRQQRTNRRADRDADAADDLGNEEEPQRAALDLGHFHAEEGNCPRRRRALRIRD